MSSNYSANQYDSAFRPKRLQNWCETKSFKERLTAHGGHTTFIADDRGHLLPKAVKRGSAWPDFKGTWDLPARIPAHHINPTSRSVEGVTRLRSWGFVPQHTDKPQPHGGSNNTDRSEAVVQQTNEDVQQDGTAPSSVADTQLASQDNHITLGERTASQNQDLQEAVLVSTTQLSEEKQTNQVTGQYRLLSQRSAPDAREETSSRPNTGKVSQASKVVEKAASKGEPLSSKQRQRDAQ